MIRDEYDGQWGVRHEQAGPPNPNAFVQTCLQNWHVAVNWQSLPALARLHEPSRGLKDSQGHVPTLAEFQAEPEVSAASTWARARALQPRASVITLNPLWSPCAEVSESPR